VEPKNREQRRHPERLEREERAMTDPKAPQSSQHDLVHDAPPDTYDERAKNSGHGKNTADKWNQ
jgi:hypothetical protein